ncbi:MAG: glycerol-3-phosphate 1-O-acyltransferase PlsY [bacterium]|nr:glycerol-3-phosphate 1-O-acyltransferase PlsY [bacterium]
MEIVLIIIISYLIGSIPTAYLVGRIFGKVDIRTVGSGNVGASNVFRIVGKTAGISVLIVDILKGFLPVLIVHCLGFDILIGIVAGLGAITGHIWTVFLKFKGGKGVATGLGVFLGLAPLPILIILVIFIIVVAITKYISLGSIIGAFLLPLLLFFFAREGIIIIFGTIASLLIIIKHLPNIKRLITGQEHKFNTKIEKS